MKLALTILIILATIIGLVVLIGYILPVKHSATRQATLRASPDSVFALIADVKGYAAWRPSVKSTELLQDVNGKMQFREVTSDGSIPFIVEEDLPGKRRVTRISDKSLPFGGTWTYELAPTTTGSTLRITEDGEIYNPVFRFMSRTVFPTHRTIETFLMDLSRKVGGEPQISP